MSKEDKMSDMELGCDFEKEKKDEMVDQLTSKESDKDLDKNRIVEMKNERCIYEERQLT
jgi:hypothetical protein